MAARMVWGRESLGARAPCKLSSAEPSVLAASGFAAELQRGEGIDRRWHQIPEAFLQQRLDILAVDMRVSAGDIVLLADRQYLVHRRGHRGMLVLPRNTEVLREVALADYHDADPRDFLQHLRQVFDRAHLLAHDRDQDLALRVERPDIGTGVVFLLGQSPITRRGGRGVAALPRRLEIRRRARAWIAAGGDCVARFLDRADMRPDNAVDALVQYLLGNPLAGLAAIGWDAHKGRHRRRQRARLHYLAAVQHVLQAIAQCANVVRPVLHFEHDAVVRRRVYRLRNAGFRC